MKISCKFGEPSWCSFPLRVNGENLSTRGGGGGVANAKPKYPPDASGGHNYKEDTRPFWYDDPPIWH